MLMRTIVSASAVAFIAFVAWVIYMANTGQHTLFFTLVKATPYGDKIGHFVLFFTLAFFVNYLLHFKKIFIYKLPINLGSIIVLIFITIEEFSQLLFIHRTFDILDLSAGIVALLLMEISSKYKITLISVVKKIHQIVFYFLVLFFILGKSKFLINYTSYHIDDSRYLIQTVFLFFIIMFSSVAFKLKTITLFKNLELNVGSIAFIILVFIKAITTSLLYALSFDYYLLASSIIAVLAFELLINRKENYFLYAISILSAVMFYISYFTICSTWQNFLLNLYRYEYLNEEPSNFDFDGIIVGFIFLPFISIYVLIVSIKYYFYIFNLLRSR